VSLDRDKLVEIETNVGTPGPFYGDTLCNINVGTSYKWREIYQMFKEETFPEPPLLPREVNLDIGVY
jgi:hypothetical protein